MKNLILATIASISLNALADFPIEKLECFNVEPVCSAEPVFSTYGSGGAGIIINDQRDLDGVIKVTANLQPVDQQSSLMTVTLKDMASGFSKTNSFSIAMGSVVFGGVEAFQASNGKKYSYLCNGSLTMPFDIPSGATVCPVK